MTTVDTGYFDQSYPPSLWGVVPATGATAGIPGSWTPAGSTPPVSPSALAAGNPVPVTASPATAWTTGQYVQTRTAGAAGRATWTGTGWVGGAAPLEGEQPGAEPEVEAPEAQGGGVEYTEPEPPAQPQRRRRSRS